MSFKTARRALEIPALIGFWILLILLFLEPADQVAIAIGITLGLPFIVSLLEQDKGWGFWLGFGFGAVGALVGAVEAGIGRNVLDCVLLIILGIPTLGLVLGGIGALGGFLGSRMSWLLWREGQEQRGAEGSKARIEEEQRRREEERRRVEEEQRRWKEGAREEPRAGFDRESRAEETHYDILGVSRNATQNEIKKAYRDKIKEYHPDKFMNQPEWVKKEAQEMSKKLNEAYEVLSDPNKRREYDSEL